MPHAGYYEIIMDGTGYRYKTCKEGMTRLFPWPQARPRHLPHTISGYGLPIHYKKVSSLLKIAYLHEPCERVSSWQHRSKIQPVQTGINMRPWCKICFAYLVFTYLIRVTLPDFFTSLPLAQKASAINT